MNKVLLVFLGLLAITSAASVQRHTAIEGVKEVVQQKGIAKRDLILSVSWKPIVENFIKKLKPIVKDEITLTLNTSIADLDLKITNFTIDNLNEAVVKKLTVDYTLRHYVKFNVLIPKVILTGKISANATIEILKKFGIKLNRKLEGDLQLDMEEVIFAGSFKYKWPLIPFRGSIKIYKFDATIDVTNVVSKIDGVFGGNKVDQLFNTAVEVAVMKLITSEQEKISEILQDTLVPFVNDKLDGENIWTIIG
ncbi:uncharacterized protein LOC129913623 [Episyrphus balteatus]|uniref:uncharacterized protein LOC129913623 n=1 Tax=Episyrphus balteatus TaxID=286459 RepID=UPI00248528EF|nr:uncharacterized protein LOC129913623 [Episyrphus balteatus]